MLLRLALYNLVIKYINHEKICDKWLVFLVVSIFSFIGFLIVIQLSYDHTLVDTLLRLTFLISSLLAVFSIFANVSVFLSKKFMQFGKKNTMLKSLLDAPVVKKTAFIAFLLTLIPLLAFNVLHLNYFSIYAPFISPLLFLQFFMNRVVGALGFPHSFLIASTLVSYLYFVWLVSYGKRILKKKADPRRIIFAHFVQSIANGIILLMIWLYFA